MKIVKQQNFNLEFFEIDVDGMPYRIGVAGYKVGELGPRMFYPECGSEYMLVIYNNGWYKFELAEFKHEFGIGYISEKLKCSEKEAKIIREFVSGLLIVDGALQILSTDNGFHCKNPFI